MRDAIAKIQTQNVKEVFEGVKDLGHLSQALPQAIEECKGAPQEFKKLFEATKRLKSPTSFLYQAGKNLYING